MKKLIMLLSLLILWIPSNSQEPDCTQLAKEYKQQNVQYKQTADTLKKVNDKWEEIEQKLKERKAAKTNP